MIRVVFLCFLMIMYQAGRSQLRKRPVFSSKNLVGLVVGQSGQAFAVQTVNGFRKQQWFAGVGAGIDFYRQRSIPVFIDIQRNFSTKAGSPFVYADLGFNWPWLTFVDREQSYFDKELAGFYYDLGIGVKPFGSKKRGLMINAGYSFKQDRQKVKKNWGAPTPQLQQEEYDCYTYSYRRIILKLGIVL